LFEYFAATNFLLEFGTESLPATVHTMHADDLSLQFREMLARSVSLLLFLQKQSWKVSGLHALKSVVEQNPNIIQFAVK